MSVEIASANLERDGWAILPPLDRDTVAQLSSIAERFCAYARSDLSVGGTAWDLERGLRNVWRTEDPAARRMFETQLAEVLAPVMSRMFPEHRAIGFGLTVKLAGLPHGPLPYHRDQALLDERSGPPALHLWIPLVDVSAENGGLIVVSGTHRTAPPVRPLGVAERDPMAECSVDELPPNAVLPRMTAGTVLIFDNRTTHASTVNRSAQDRPAVMLALLPHGSRMIEWVPRGDRIELWEVREQDSSYAGRSAARIRLLETLPWSSAFADERHEPEAPQETASVREAGADVREAIAPLLDRAGAGSGWRLSAARVFKQRIVIDWDHESGGLQILLERLAPGQPCFKQIRDLGLSYNPPRNATGKLDAAGLALLESLAPLAESSIDALRALMERAPS